MTFNLANYDDHDQWPERLQIIVDVIIDKQPDIISFQESRFNPDQPTTQSFYQCMGEQVLFSLNNRQQYIGCEILTQPVMYYARNEAPYYPLPSTLLTSGVEWEGLSIISKKHIVETGTRFLTIAQPSDTNKRSVKYIAFPLEDGSLFYVFDCHYSYELPNFNLNVKETIEYMKPFMGSPCLLMGDMNINAKNKEAYQPFVDGGYYDIWELLWPNDPGITAPFDDPQQRIDFIWANNTIPQSKIKFIELVAKKPVNNLYASDHYGLMTIIDY